MPKPKIKKRSKFHSLRATVALAFLALSTAVLFISSSLNIYFGLLNQRKAIDVQQDLSAQKAASSVKEFISDKFNTLLSCIDFTNMHRASPDDQKLALEKLLGIEPSFRQLTLLDPGGKELVNVSRLSRMVPIHLTDQIERELFSQVNQGKKYISTINIDQTTYEPLVVMAVPVTNVFGDVTGVLAAEVNLKFLWDLMDQIKIGKKGLAYVVDMHGYLIAFSDVSRVLKRENLAYLSEVHEFIEGNELVHQSRAEISKGILNTCVLTTHVHLGTPDWAVVVELPVLEAYRTVLVTFTLSILVMIFSFILAIVSGIFLSKRITRPIIELRDAAKKIGQGHMTTKIDITSKNEIGELAESFNNMVENLNSTTVSRDSLINEVARRKQAEEQIRTSLKEKEVLLKEIHHRVKNNMQVVSSLLNLQSRYIKDEEAQQLFRESQDRVRSMALIHEKLYQSGDLSKIDFGEYIQNLVDYLFRSYGVNSNNIVFKKSVNGMLLGIHTAIPCGLIINELVSNSLKHAFPGNRHGEIRLDLHQNDDRFELVVSDDGIGFPKDVDFRNTESLGLQLVNSLTNQLDGTIEMEDGDGASFRIVFAESQT
jgi:two-component sensor histidine kinase/HAMP domain-containing protein